MSLGLTCDGTVTQIDAFTLQCSGSWVMQSITSDFDPSTIDPTLMAGAIATGFFIMVPLWAAGSAGRALLKSITPFGR